MDIPAKHVKLWTEVMDDVLEVNRITSNLICDLAYSSRYKACGGSTSISSMIRFVKTYPPEARRRMLGRLRRCRCCSRHSHYKDVPYKPEFPVPESKQVGRCYCRCRAWYREFTSIKIDVD